MIGWVRRTRPGPGRPQLSMLWAGPSPPHPTNQKTALFPVQQAQPGSPQTACLPDCFVSTPGPVAASEGASADAHHFSSISRRKHAARNVPDARSPTRPDVVCCCAATNQAAAAAPPSPAHTLSVPRTRGRVMPSDKERLSIFGDWGGPHAPHAFLPPAWRWSLFNQSL
jgi:hypothetical protein